VSSGGIERIAGDQDQPTCREARGSAGADRLPFLDLLRGLASQLIVWHHLAFYGPLSDIAYPLAPGLIDWLFVYGRMAVQVFLVVGGFVTARGLERQPELDGRAVLRFVVRRYRRIGLPYLTALALAIAANALAARWLVGDPSLISPPPTLGQVLAHVVYLQNILGYESLSAGVWYLAIDFQLGVLAVGVTALAHGLARALGRENSEAGAIVIQGVFWPLALGSLFAFNRDPRLDVWAIYHMGAYFLGMMSRGWLSGRGPRWGFPAYAALMVAALVYDWRPRLLVALLTGLAIVLAGRVGLLARWPTSRWVGYLGRISYSVFLIHFPVQLVVSSGLSRFASGAPGIALAGMVASYLLSLAAAIVFYHAVEARCLPPHGGDERRSRPRPGAAT
jgi:peptidoglycan/LPS O-acetylase OafA/YrhL